MTAPESRSERLKPFQPRIAIGATLLFAVLFTGALVVFQIFERVTEERYDNSSLSISQSQVDLVTGFLHVTASGAPFSRDQGFALMKEASETLLRFATTMDESEVANSILRFSDVLTSAKEASSLDVRMATELRIAYSNLDRKVAAWEEHILHLRQNRSRKNSTLFALVIALGVVLFIATNAFIRVLERRSLAWERSLRESEARLRSAVDEREILLKELYHRTKNNMQVIASMMSLRADQSKNREIRTIMGEMFNRIMSMELVHEKLYRSENLSHLHLRDYLEDLGALLLDGQAVERSNSDGMVDLRLTIADVDVSIETAIPLGLILTELFSNSMKHAFKNGRSGRIEVQVDQDAEGLIVLHYSDDGPGFPQNFDPYAAQGLGLKIVLTLCEGQLLGTARFDSDEGLHFWARFAERKSPSTVVSL